MTIAKPQVRSNGHPSQRPDQDVVQEVPNGNGHATDTHTTNPRSRATDTLKRTSCPLLGGATDKTQVRANGHPTGPTDTTQRTPAVCLKDTAGGRVDPTPAPTSRRTC